MPNSKNPLHGVKLTAKETAEEYQLSEGVPDSALRIEELPPESVEVLKVKDVMKKLRQQTVEYHNVLRDYQTHIAFQNEVILKLRQQALASAQH